MITYGFKLLTILNPFGKGLFEGAALVANHDQTSNLLTESQLLQSQQYLKETWR